MLWLFFIAGATLLQASNGLEWASLYVKSTMNGEIWRVITGHLVHLDWPHWGMNMLGLSLCLLVFRNDLKVRHWLFSFLFISLVSSIGLLVIYEENQRYVGFSDVLHGWILIGAAAIAHKEPKLALAIFVLFWLKIWEENSGLAFFTSAAVQGTIAKESHIFGAIGGMVYALMFIPGLRQALRIQRRPADQQP